MAGPEILVTRGTVQNPVLSPVTEVWYRNSANLLARASAAYVVSWPNPADKATYKLVPMFQGLPAPTLTVKAKDASSITLTWTQVAGAVKYQILQRTGEAKGDEPYTIRKEIVPSSGTAWTTRIWKLATGFAKDKVYILSVRAINSVGQIGPETNPAIRYSPGRSEKVEKNEGTSDSISIPPAACASYDSEKKWTRFPTDVCEGFVRGSTSQTRNRWGCIDYSNAYGLLNARYGKASNGVVIADHITVIDVYLKDIVRFDDSHPATAEMRFHPATFTIGVPTAPVITTSGVNATTQNVMAPAPGKARGVRVNITDNSWGKKWADKSSATNGLVLHRDDGGGAVRMEGINASFPNNWVLVLEYTWSVVVQTAQGPTAVAWTFTG